MLYTGLLSSALCIRTYILLNIYTSGNVELSELSEWTRRWGWTFRALQMHFHRLTDWLISDELDGILTQSNEQICALFVSDYIDSTKFIHICDDLHQWNISVQIYQDLYCSTLKTACSTFPNVALLEPLDTFESNCLSFSAHCLFENECVCGCKETAIVHIHFPTPTEIADTRNHSAKGHTPPCTQYLNTF